MDDMEASYIFYIKHGTFDKHEQSNIHVLTNTKCGVVMLTIQYDLVIGVSFIKYPWDGLGQSSPDVFSGEGFPVYM
jgi:hypothetical protein